jgi:hypothetical protein
VVAGDSGPRLVLADRDRRQSVSHQRDNGRKSKPPQTGTEYSNEYVAELQKQGLSMQEIIKRVTERDIELPNEVNLHYFLYCVDLKSGKIDWSKEFHTAVRRRPPSQKQFRFGNAGN